MTTAERLAELRAQVRAARRAFRREGDLDTEFEMLLAKAALADFLEQHPEMRA